MYRRIRVFDDKAHEMSWVAMCRAGLPGQNYKKCTFTWHRPRYFFTEDGWKKFGHIVVSGIRSGGFTAKIISIKEKDPRIKIIYRDEWQVAIVFGGKKRDQI